MLDEPELPLSLLPPRRLSRPPSESLLAVVVMFLVPDGKGGLISLEDLQKEQDRIVEVLRRRAKEGRDADRDGSTRIIASPPDPK